MQSTSLTDAATPSRGDVERPRSERHVDHHLGSRRRSIVGGPAFMGSYVAARMLGRIHPRLARRHLLRLWFTPWAHPSTRRPLADVATDLLPWSLPIGGLTLHGFSGGTGPTALLVHGWAGRAADWRHLASDLIAAGWRVVAPDLPAHGMTAGRSTDLFELGRALRRVLDHERPAAVVTHSLGFPTALGALEDGAAVPATWIALAPGRKMAHALTRFTEKAALPPALTAELRRGIEARFGADIWDVLDVDRLVPQLGARGLVIHDADDDEVEIADGAHIASAWGGARFVTSSGLGHRRILRDAHVRRTIVDALR